MFVFIWLGRYLESCLSWMFYLSSVLVWWILVFVSGWVLVGLCLELLGIEHLGVLRKGIGWVWAFDVRYILYIIYYTYIYTYTYLYYLILYSSFQFFSSQYLSLTLTFQYSFYTCRVLHILIYISNTNQEYYDPACFIGVDGWGVCRVILESGSGCV